jgi:class 3 adenylate cyclase
VRNGFMGGFAIVLLFAVVFLSQRNRISKEKKRSEELLLNILPEETAEELKETGKAKVKSFDAVTVMFTDFKNFTLASEKLTPEELVQEINFCYSEFDKIITKYGIEKIKTIGDSYMCAGGLPVSNTTHPFDVVSAGLEMQAFIEKNKLDRIEKGIPFFELRLGIHTGPVVAGIVGIKKFAYDIWGDAVNLASRMESSGEVGRVNISKSTYEFVKDKFKCTYRGKVYAKNKGEIDMYFIDKI